MTQPLLPMLMTSKVLKHSKKSLLEHEDVDHVLIMPLGPVISAHVGPGTLAVFSVGKEAR